MCSRLIVSRAGAAAARTVFAIGIMQTNNVYRLDDDAISEIMVK